MSRLDDERTAATPAAPPATDSPSTGSPAVVPGSRQALAAVAVCWLLVVCDGYDLIVYGSVQNQLINATGWGLNAASAGTIGSMVFIGMMIGALAAGRIADSLGRKRAILACALIFSVFTAACALATGPVMFGAFRLIAGIGLGGLVPTANALAAELVGPRWRAMVATLMMSGVPIGGVIAATSGMAVIPAAGWRPMFGIALIAAVVLVPIGARVIPETLQARAPGAEKAGFGTLLRAPYLGASLLFAAASFATLFAWYGLGTQLPKIMGDSGFDLGSALSFTLALNLGAVAGSLITAWAGDRFGPVPSAIIAAVIAGAALIAIFVADLPTPAVYAALVLAGIGTHGTQCLIIAAITSSLPAHLRDTGLGWALGVGRIGAVLAPQTSGLLLASAFSPLVSLLVFGGGALLAAGTLLGVLGFVRARRAAIA